MTVTGVVRRRHVFFLSGFDPKGASWYHRLYQTEAQRQSAGAGAAGSYRVGPRIRMANGNSEWTVESTAGEGIVQTTYEYARWDDIVRQHWPRNGWQVLRGAMLGYWMALSSGNLAKVRRVAPRTLIALAYPAVFWVAAFAGAAGAGALMGWSVARALPWALASVAGVAAFAAVWMAALRLEQRLNTSWLLRIYHFARDWSRGRTPAVQPRIDAVAADVLRALQDPAIDEVLLVGFSVGSLLAACAAAQVRHLALAQGLALDKLSLLTLGQCIPLLGLAPRATAFRAALVELVQAPAVHWVDYSSPADWGTFALTDPVALCVPAVAAHQPPRMLSPRFHTLFAPAVYARLCRDKRRMHLQYLMAGDLPSDYDYFAITAGPRTLAARLAALPR